MQENFNPQTESLERKKYELLVARMSSLKEELNSLKENPKNELSDEDRESLERIKAELSEAGEMLINNPMFRKHEVEALVAQLEVDYAESVVDSVLLERFMEEDSTKITNWELSDRVVNLVSPEGLPDLSKGKMYGGFQKMHIDLNNSRLNALIEAAQNIEDESLKNEYAGKVKELIDKGLNYCDEEHLERMVADGIIPNTYILLMDRGAIRREEIKLQDITSRAEETFGVEF